MTKPKQKKSKIERSLTQQKKLKKQEQIQQFKQLQTKRQRYYGFAIAVILLALVISFVSSTVYGQPVYDWLQIACYGLMAVCGIVTILATRCEQLDKKRKRMLVIGVIFVLIAVAMGLQHLVKLFM